MPTLLELARVERPPSVDGGSMVPSLRVKPVGMREWIHIEHAPVYAGSQAFHALIDRRYKYIWRPQEGREQLFDLQSDPQEVNDLAAEAGHRALLGQWRARLVQRLAGRPEGFSDGRQLIAGRQYPPLSRPAKQ